MTTIKNVKTIQKKSRSHTVTPTGPSTFAVTSGASGNQYRVHINGSSGSCSCEWAKYRPAGDGRCGCSHVVAVFDYLATEAGRKVSAWNSQEEAQRQHRPRFSIGDGVILTSRRTF